MSKQGRCINRTSTYLIHNSGGGGLATERDGDLFEAVRARVATAILLKGEEKFNERMQYSDLLSKLTGVFNATIYNEGWSTAALGYCGVQDLRNRWERCSCHRHPCRKHCHPDERPRQEPIYSQAYGIVGEAGVAEALLEVADVARRTLGDLVVVAGMVAVDGSDGSQWQSQQDRKTRETHSGRG